MTDPDWIWDVDSDDEETVPVLFMDVFFEHGDEDDGDD